MDKNEIIKIARKYLKDEMEVKNLDEAIDAENVIELVNYLEDYYLEDKPKDRLIHFNILQRSSDCDYWLEAATYADLKSGEGSRFITIVFEHDVKMSEDFNDLMEDIFDLENEAQEVLKSLDPVRYIVKLDN